MDKIKGISGLGKTTSKFTSENGLICGIQRTPGVQQGKGKWHFILKDLYRH